MKYYFFTYSGFGLPLAYHLQQEGQIVKVGLVARSSMVGSEGETPEREDRELRKRRMQRYEGILQKTSAELLVKELLQESDPKNCFVCFEHSRLYRYADKLRERGFHGNFPTARDYELEINRNEAKEFVRQHYAKLQIAEKMEFSSIRKGITFLRDSNDLWVLKAKGLTGRTIVPDITDPALANDQLIEALETAGDTYTSGGFILEQLINPVVELRPEKIYYNGKPVCTTLSLENKPLGSGNISVQTGCAADLVFGTDIEEAINQVAFPEIVDEIARKHDGLFIWDASILIDARSGKMYFGEFCANRFGYNAIFTDIALSGGSVHKFFENLMSLTNPYPTGKVGVSLRLFNLQYDKKGYLSAEQRLAFPEKIEQDLWIWDVKRAKHGFETTGFETNVLVATGAGQTIAEATKRMYESVSKVSLEGVYYRPRFDYVSREYPTALLNRLDYGLSKNLFKVGFATH